MTDPPATFRPPTAKDARKQLAEAEAWMEDARHELQTLGMEPGFIRHYPITAEQYRDLADRCPLPEPEQEPEP